MTLHIYFAITRWFSGAYLTSMIPGVFESLSNELSISKSAFLGILTVLMLVVSLTIERNLWGHTPRPPCAFHKCPNKCEKTTQCWVDVGPASKTLARHPPSIGWTYRLWSCVTPHAGVFPCNSPPGELCGQQDITSDPPHLTSRSTSGSLSNKSYLVEKCTDLSAVDHTNLFNFHDPECDISTSCSSTVSIWSGIKITLLTLLRDHWYIPGLFMSTTLAHHNQEL